jgi:hypothetical protein
MKYLFAPARPSRIGWAARPVVAALALFLAAPAAQAQFKLPNLGAKLEKPSTVV